MSNRKPLVIGLVVLGVVFVAVSFIYFTKTANDLPSLLPGHADGSTKHHTKHGIAMLGLAVLSFLGAWMLSGPTEQEPTS